MDNRRKEELNNKGPPPPLYLQSQLLLSGPPTFNYSQTPLLPCFPLRPHPDQSELSVFNKSDDSRLKPTDLDISDEAKKKNHSLAEKKRRDAINMKIKDIHKLVSPGDDSPSKAVSLQRIVEYVEKLKEYSSQLSVNISNISKENEELKRNLVSLRQSEIGNQVPISKIVCENSVKIEIPSDDEDSEERDNDSKQSEKSTPRKIVFLGLMCLIFLCIPSTFRLTQNIYSSRALLSIAHTKPFIRPLMIFFGILAHICLSMIFVLVAYTLLLILFCIIYNDLPKTNYSSPKTVDHSLNDRIYMKELAFRLYLELQGINNPIPTTFVMFFLCFSMLRYILQRLWVGRFVDSLLLFNLPKLVMTKLFRSKSNIEEDKRIYYTLKLWESLLYYEFGSIVNSAYMIHLGSKVIDEIPNDKLALVF